MKRIRNLLGTMTLILIASALGTSQADGAFMMSFDRLTTTGAPVGAAPLVITDEGAGDGLPGAPAELKPSASSIDGFLMLTARAVFSPVAGPLPEIDLLYNVMNTSGARSRFEIKTTGTDFNDVGAINTFMSAVSATSSLGDVVSIDTFVDNSNVPFGTATLLDSFGPAHVTTATPFSDDSMAFVPSLTSPFSMTIVLTVEVDNFKSIGGNLSTVKLEGSGEEPIPEPSAFVLGVIGLLLMGLYVHRRRGRLQ